MLVNGHTIHLDKCWSDRRRAQISSVPTFLTKNRSANDQASIKAERRKHSQSLVSCKNTATDSDFCVGALKKCKMREAFSEKGSAIIYFWQVDVECGAPRKVVDKKWSYKRVCASVIRRHPLPSLISPWCLSRHSCHPLRSPGASIVEYCGAVSPIFHFRRGSKWEASFNHERFMNVACMNSLTRQAIHFASHRATPVHAQIPKEFAQALRLTQCWFGAGSH